DIHPVGWIALEKFERRGAQFVRVLLIVLSRDLENGFFVRERVSPFPRIRLEAGRKLRNTAGISGDSAVLVSCDLGTERRDAAIGRQRVLRSPDRSKNRERFNK